MIVLRLFHPIIVAKAVFTLSISFSGTLRRIPINGTQQPMVPTGQQLNY